LERRFGRLRRARTDSPNSPSSSSCISWPWNPSGTNRWSGRSRPQVCRRRRSAHHPVESRLL